MNPTIGDPAGDAAMPLVEHLSELRTRLMYALLYAAVGFALCFWFARDLLFLLKAPYLAVLPPGAPGIQLIRVQDKFLVDLYVALYGGLIASAPGWMYELWRFVAPGLHHHERSFAVPFLAASGVLFAVGAAFCYLVVLPFTFRFFLAYNLDGGTLWLTQSMAETLKAGGHPIDDLMQTALLEYVQLTGLMLAAFGLAFETPLFMVLAVRSGLVEHRTFREGRRVAVVVIFIVAAILTPPDPVSQVALALPLVVLYEAGLWVSRGVTPRTAETVAA